METPRRTFWTKGRRRALSSTSLTLFQVLLGGAVLGGALGKFEPPANWVLVGSIAVLLVIGIVAAPSE